MDTSIDLKLPALPDVMDPQLFQQFFLVYNAIKTLATALDEYTGEGKGKPETEITEASKDAIILSLQAEVRRLKEQLEFAEIVPANFVDWESPGELGLTESNNVHALDVIASGTIKGGILEGNDVIAHGDTILEGRFGANGSSPQGPYVLPANASDLPTTQALANALKAALISFGLGVA